MNDFVKNKIRWKHQIFKNYIKNGREYSVYFKFQEAKNLVSQVISGRKNELQNHLALKLNDPVTGAET